MPSHRSAFAGQAEPGAEPVEVALVRALRADAAWLPALSLVAEDDHGAVVGHVVASSASLPGCSAVGLGPIGVLSDHQGCGVGSALMHAVLGAADALDIAVVVLLGHTGYYPRFGFEPAAGLGIVAPDPTWGEHFQARTLTAWTTGSGSEFHYAARSTRCDSSRIGRRSGDSGTRRRDSHDSGAFAKEPTDRLVVRMPPAKAERVARGVGVDLVSLDCGQIVALQQPGAKRDRLGVGAHGVIDVEIEVDLLRFSVRPVGRDMVGGQLNPDDPSAVRVEDAVECVVG
jgi:putative acetyltransferase